MPGQVGAILSPTTAMMVREGVFTVQARAPPARCRGMLYGTNCQQDMNAQQFDTGGRDLNGITPSGQRLGSRWSQRPCFARCIGQGPFLTRCERGRRYWWDGAHAATAPVSERASASSFEAGRLILISRLEESIDVREKVQGGVTNSWQELRGPSLARQCWEVASQ